MRGTPDLLIKYISELSNLLNLPWLIIDLSLYNWSIWSNWARPLMILVLQLCFKDHSVYGLDHQ